MNKIEMAYYLLQDIIELLNDLDYGYFIPIFCMVAEEYSKAHRLDVRDTMQDATSMVYQVYNELGEY